jgi:DNA-binding MarR family transcriptional regulator
VSSDPGPDPDGVVRAVEAAMTDLFRLAGSRRVHADRQRRSRTDLSRTEWELLRRVDDLGPLRVGRLADLVGLSPAVTSRALAALEQQDLVVRAATPDDGRGVAFRASTAGRRARARFQAAMEDELGSVLARWVPADRDALARLFPRLVDELRHTAAPDPDPSTESGPTASERSGKGARPSTGPPTAVG